MIEKKFLLILPILIIILILSVNVISEGNETTRQKVVYFFYSPTCPHCKKEEPFLQDLEKKYPQLKVEYIEAAKNPDLLSDKAREYDTTTAGVPRTFIKDKVFIGFSEGDGKFIYNDAYKAYMGYKNQIRKAIEDYLNVSYPFSKEKVIEISKNGSPLVKKIFLENNESLIASTELIDGIYFVSWWTPERIKSNLQYPDVLVKVNSTTGEIIDAKIPDKKVEGIEKPFNGKPIKVEYLFVLVIILLYPILYLLLRNKLKFEKRYWIVCFIFLLIISSFYIAVITPNEVFERFINNISNDVPFGVFVFVVALLDGLNPCAFFVLIVLLSLLTYTKSRKYMALIASIFIVTSALMYFLSIMLIITLSSVFFETYKFLLMAIFGILMLIGGIVNLKDYFFFKKGFSFEISGKNKGKIMKKAGKIVRDVKKAESKSALLFPLIGVVILAVFVNLVELGCTAMFPVAYTALLFQNFGSEPGIVHYLYTAFYAIVYVIPLFVILLNFLYSFKTDRLTEKQARLLKLVGGFIMLLFGLILIFAPDFLTLGVR